MVNAQGMKAEEAERLLPIGRPAWPWPGQNINRCQNAFACWSR